MKERINQQINKNLFNEIDINLLFGMQCSGNNKSQQNDIYKIRSQTESAFINKKYNNFKNQINFLNKNVHLSQLIMKES